MKYSLMFTLSSSFSTKTASYFGQNLALSPKYLVLVGPETCHHFVML